MEREKIKSAKLNIYAYMGMFRELPLRFLKEFKDYTVGELCKLKVEDILKHRNVGRTSVDSVELFLEEHGLRLGMSEDELEEYWYAPAKEFEKLLVKRAEDAINWEERRWGLVAMNMPDEVDYNGRWKRIFDKTIFIADEWIRMYKERLEKERKQL